MKCFYIFSHILVLFSYNLDVKNVFLPFSYILWIYHNHANHIVFRWHIWNIFSSKQHLPFRKHFYSLPLMSIHKILILDSKFVICTKGTKIVVLFYCLFDGFGEIKNMFKEFSQYFSSAMIFQNFLQFMYWW